MKALVFWGNFFRNNLVFALNNFPSAKMPLVLIFYFFFIKCWLQFMNAFLRRKSPELLSFFQIIVWSQFQQIFKDWLLTIFDRQSKKKNNNRNSKWGALKQLNILLAIMHLHSPGVDFINFFCSLRPCANYRDCSIHLRPTPSPKFWEAILWRKSSA